MPTYLTVAFYKFVELADYESLREPLQLRCDELNIKGTILLAREGINSTIAGSSENIHALLAHLRSDPRLSDLVHKEAFSDKPPFRRMKIRLKREIVTMGVPGVDPTLMVGTYVKPEDWNRLIDDPEVTLIDVRNDYEVAIGSFKGAIDPKTQTFGEFPDWVRGQKDLGKKTKVAMFCTGGIRCEKSTAFLRAEGFSEVYHLEGGILKYLETVPEADSRWHGACFVFDERVAVEHGLRPGDHSLCRACRQPITAADKTSPLFAEGISCPNCHGTRSKAQLQGATERQRQFELASARDQPHIGAKFEKKSAKKP